MRCLVKKKNQVCSHIMFIYNLKSNSMRNKSITRLSSINRNAGTNRYLTFIVLLLAYLATCNAQCTNNPLDWPLFIGDGTTPGTMVEVESLDVDGSGNLVLGVESTDLTFSYHTSNRHIVYYYDTSTRTYAWEVVLSNTNKWLNVFFADSDAKVLLTFSDNTSGTDYWTFAFLNSADGALIGNMAQQDMTGGKIFHSSVAIKSDATSIYVMTNFPDDLQGGASVGQNTLSALSFDGTNWSKFAQQTFDQNHHNDVQYYQKNAVFMAQDENFVFSLSSSQGGNKKEDCTLVIWNSGTLAIPQKDKELKKNHASVLRNCVHPHELNDPINTDLWVLVVAEYLEIPTNGDTFTGFIRYQLDGAYSMFDDTPKNYDIKYIPDVRLVITSTFCPTNSEWYAMATSATENMILYFEWSGTTTSIWVLASHSNLHIFSHILSAPGLSGTQLPIAGYYAGNASTVDATSTLGCSFSFTDIAGHVTKLELGADSCVTEATPLTPTQSSLMTTDTGDGHGVKCGEDLQNTHGSNIVNYIVPAYSFFDLCTVNDFTSEMWQSNSLATLPATYVIDSGPTVERFEFLKTIDGCTLEIEVYELIGAAWVVHDDTVVTAAVGAQAALKDEIDVTIDTLDLSQDPDGTVTPSTRSFKISASSPDFALSLTGPVEVFLDVTLHHPCRYAVFNSAPMINAMTTKVDDGPKTQNVTPILHNLDGIYDCGLQKIEIDEHVALHAYSYSDILTGSTQSTVADDLVITFDSNNVAHAGDHFPTATVSLIDWPAITITTSPFTATVVNCYEDTYSAFTWTDASQDMGLLEHKIEVDSGMTFQFISVTNTKVDCTPVYSLFLDTVGLGSYLPYTDLNVNYDIVDFDAGPTDSTEIVVTTLTAEDMYLVSDTWHVRVTVASVPDATLATSPQHIFVQLYFGYPQQYVCPVENPWFYSPNYPNNPYPLPDDDITQEWRKVIIDDELARITRIDYCTYPKIDYNQPGRVIQFQHQHFRGFTAYFDTSTGEQSVTVGEMVNQCEILQTVTFPEEIMYFTMNVDQNDIEGIAFRDYAQSFDTACDAQELISMKDAVAMPQCWTKISANGNSYDVRHSMLGRPIGFDTRMGDGGPIYPNDDDSGPLTPQPLAMKVIYNICNCPASTFTGDIAPRDMQITVIQSPTDYQNNLPYQLNYMEYMYGQDCGSYTTELQNQGPEDMSAYLILDPPTGAGGAFGYPWSQGITLSTSDQTLVGQYVVDMVVKQVPANGDFFINKQGAQATIPEVRYPMTVTINPCVVTSINTVVAPSTMIYTLGDPAQSQTYQLDQAPDICYTETVTLDDVTIVSLTPPADTSNQIDLAYSEDRSLLGDHTIKLTKSISQPDDWSMTTYSTVAGGPNFLVQIIDPCLTTTINEFGASNMIVWVQKGPVINESLTAKDEVSYRLGDQSGLTYCGDRVFSIVGVTPTVPDYNEFLSLDVTNFKLVAQSNEERHVGTYTVTVLFALADFLSISATVDFDVEIKFCKIEKLTWESVLPQQYMVQMPQIEFSWNDFVQEEDCGWPITYAYYIVDPEGEIFDLLEDMPEFLSQEDYDHKFVVQTNDSQYQGNYKIQIYPVVEDQYVAWKDTAWFTATMTEVITPLEIDLEIIALWVVVPNDFDESVDESVDESGEDEQNENGSERLEDKVIYIFEGLHYNIEDTLVDCPDNTVSIVEVETGSATGCLTFDSSTNIFLIEEGVAGPPLVGSHQITVQQTCSNSTFTEKHDDSFDLTIEGPLTLTNEQETLALVQELEEQGQQVHEWKVRNSTELEEFSPEQPVPHIVQLTPSGVLQIGWDREMRVPQNITEIQPTRVALRLEAYNNTVYNHYWRNLHRRYEYILNEQNRPESLLTAESLELKVRVGESSHIPALNFTWEIRAYTENYIWIQLYFENPPRVSENIEEEDQLEIYFWGNDNGFFYAKEFSHEVRFGTMISTPMIRQVDPILEEKVGAKMGVFKSTLLSGLFFIAVITGRLLPVWMFINQLCLLCHTQYFKTNMPGFVAYFLTELLSIPRFNLFPLWKSSLTTELGYAQSGSHNEIFKAHDYDSVHFVANMAHIIYLYIPLLAIVWLLAFLKDSCVSFSNRCNRDVQRQHKRLRCIFLLIRHEPWMHNFINRFIYEIFFEVCICSMISLANNKAMQFQQKEEMIIACSLLACISVFTIYIARLYWTRLFDRTRLKWSEIKAYFCPLSRQEEDEEESEKEDGRIEIDDHNWVNNELNTFEQNATQEDLIIRQIKIIQSQDKRLDLPRVEQKLPEPLPEPPLVRTDSDELAVNIYDGEERFITSARAQKNIDPMDDIDLNDPFYQPIDIRKIKHDTRKRSRNTEHQGLAKQRIKSNLQPKKIMIKRRNDTNYNDYINNYTNNELYESGEFKPDQRQQYEGGSIEQKMTTTDVSIKTTDQVLNTEYVLTMDNGELIDSNVKFQAKVNIDTDSKLFKSVRKEGDASYWRIRTFFFGLKLFEPDNGHMKHLIVYLVRRIVYAGCLVFMHESPKIGIISLMISSITMLAILWGQNQWWDREIMIQHVVNEVTLYIICLQLIMFTDVFDCFSYYDHMLNGIVMIALIIFNLFFNVHVIFFYCLRFIQRYLQRKENLLAYRKLRKSRSDIKSIAKKRYQYLQTQLATKTQDNWNAQWKHMLDEKEGWTRQEAIGKDHYSEIRTTILMKEVKVVGKVESSRQSKSSLKYLALPQQVTQKIRIERQHHQVPQKVEKPINKDARLKCVQNLSELQSQQQQRSLFALEKERVNDRANENTGEFVASEDSENFIAVNIYSNNEEMKFKPADHDQKESHFKEEQTFQKKNMPQIKVTLQNGKGNQAHQIWDNDDQSPHCSLSRDKIQYMQEFHIQGRPLSAQAVSPNRQTENMQSKLTHEKSQDEFEHVIDEALALKKQATIIDDLQFQGYNSRDQLYYKLHEPRRASKQSTTVPFKQQEPLSNNYQLAQTHQIRRPTDQISRNGQTAVYASTPHTSITNSLENELRGIRNAGRGTLDAVDEISEAASVQVTPRNNVHQIQTTQHSLRNFAERDDQLFTRNMSNFDRGNGGNDFFNNLPMRKPRPSNLPNSSTNSHSSLQPRNAYIQQRNNSVENQYGQQNSEYQANGSTPSEYARSYYK